MKVQLFWLQIGFAELAYSRFHRTGKVLLASYIHMYKVQLCRYCTLTNFSFRRLKTGIEGKREPILVLVVQFGQVHGLLILLISV